MTLMELTAILSLDSSGFNKGLSSANALAKGFAVKAVDSIMKVGKSIVKTGFEYNKEMETMQTSFMTMTGSAEEASGIMERLKTMAAETPFESKDLAKTTQLLMQYGFTADDAIDKMAMLGDIAQGNAQAMTSVATGYAQMHSAGKVNLQDIKQMINAGFNPLQEISERTGESMESLYDRISKGKMSVDEITESMIYATSEGGKFFGAMENQSKTMNGQLSTLSENWNSFAGGLISPLTDQLQEKVLPELNASMAEISEIIFGVSEEIADSSPWEKFAGAVGDVAVNAIEKLKGALVWILDNGDAVKTGLTVIAGGFSAIFAVTHPAVAAILAVSGAVTAFVSQWDSDKSVFENVTDIAGSISTTIVDGGLKLVGVDGYRQWASDTESAIVNAFNSVKNAVGTAIDSVGSFFSVSIPSGFSGAVEWIKGAFEDIKQFIVDAATAIKDFFNIKVGGVLTGAIDGVKSAISGITSAAQSAYEWLNKIMNFSPAGAAEKVNSAMQSGRSFISNGRAVGIDYVPYNGYAASLHEGEMVLTKLEAERFRKNEERGLNSTSGNYGATASEIATAVASALMNVGIDIDGKRAGRLMRKGSSSAQNDYSKSLARGYGY